MAKIRLLITDPSPVFQKLLVRKFEASRNIEVVGTAANAFEARDKIVKLKPDVMTLAFQMELMTGVEFLKKLIPQYPMPVIMVAENDTRLPNLKSEAIRAGAMDFIDKATDSAGLPVMLNGIEALIKARFFAKIAMNEEPENPNVLKAYQDKVSRSPRIIAIGSSTGGPEALSSVLPKLPAYTPGIVVVQHMPEGFTQSFAQRLDNECALRVKEAINGDIISRGQVLIAPGNKHMSILVMDGTKRVHLSSAPPVFDQRPSVEVLMQSVAKNIGKLAVGVMLTGMGKDGATGLKAMKDRGATTIGQDEASSVVYGMAKEAHDLGAIDRLEPLDKIASAILKACAN